MGNLNGSDCVRFIREHQNPLIVAGEGCNHIKFDHKMLTNYVAEMAQKLDCQVAATGNIIKEIEKHQGIKVKKAWLGELIASLKGEWADPILPQRPDILIFIGYRPDMIDGMIADLKQIDTVHLGPGKSQTAGRCVEDAGLSQWKRYLEEFIGSI